ncbi:hypothetical protein PAALTS15_03022 [Paenibacillus alvei TS-15]|uniref:Uncharacterized protein n=1 Tax=Paenibacillus alvei TS-15 TaxID=1117108 RepID=S9SXP9_PAEAL|nr:hypothetical protein PAALTS15_03022 [Paenibacillus alvei TS-15]
MPLMKSRVFCLGFVNELRMLWRGEIGTPKYKKWRRYFLYIYSLVILYTVSYRIFFGNENIPDSRGIMVCGFVLTVFIWSSLKVLDFFNSSAKLHLFSLSPLSSFIYISSQLTAHWLFHSTIMFILAIPSILNMAMGGHVDILLGYPILYVLSLGVVSLAWTIFSLIVRMYGVEGGKIFQKTLAVLFSIILLFGGLWYKNFFEVLTFWWTAGNGFVLLKWGGLFLVVGIVLFVMSVCCVCSTFKAMSRNAGSKKIYGGAKQLVNQGFIALLTKEYRLLLRLMKKMLLFVSFNYCLSFGLSWLLFRIIQPNEMYLYISSMMFSAIFIAGPGNVLSVSEEHSWRMLRASPTSIPRVLMAKSLAVYSIFGPISLVFMGLFLNITYDESNRIYMGLLTCFIIGMLSVWNGAVETMIKIIGHGFREMLFISVPNLIGSLFIVISVYHITVLNTIFIVALLIAAAISYAISFLLAFRWLK